jgi:hypothetical protein
MAVDLKHIEQRVDRLEQEVAALRAEAAQWPLVAQAGMSPIEVLQQQSRVIAQRTGAVFHEMGIPDQPTMSLTELQAAMEPALAPNALTQTLLEMREE